MNKRIRDVIFYKDLGCVEKHILNNNFCSTDYKSFFLSSYYCIFELTTSLNQIKMKKKHVLLAAFAAAMLTPTVAWAQYPQITDEAKENYKKMMTEERKRSDEAWAKALPIVQKEAKEGRPYIPWAGRPYDLPQADIPSFPGAEGGGMYSFGGRGGKVITVTNLNDRGPGSFREACETGGARIIVFNVAGIIRLESPIIVRAPYVTIAGQTAPGDGVCIAGESFGWIHMMSLYVTCVSVVEKRKYGIVMTLRREPCW